MTGRRGGATSTGMPSTPVLSRSWIGHARIVLPAIVVGAGAQAALVTVDPIPSADGAFPLLFAVSLALAILELAVIAVGTGSRFDRTPFTRTPSSPSSPPPSPASEGTVSADPLSAPAPTTSIDARPVRAPVPLLRRAVAAVIASAVGISLILVIATFSPPVALVVAAIALPPIAALATGRSMRNWFRSLRRRPGHAVLWTAIAVLLGLAVAAASYPLGLFIGGPVAAFLTWVLAAVSVALVLGEAARAPYWYR